MQSRDENFYNPIDPPLTITLKKKIIKELNFDEYLDKETKAFDFNSDLSASRGSHYFTDLEFQTLLSYLHENEVEYLNLPCAGLGDEQASKLFTIPSLTHINLSANIVTGEFLNHIPSEKIQQITLYECRLLDAKILSNIKIPFALVLNVDQYIFHKKSFEILQRNNPLLAVIGLIVSDDASNILTKPTKAKKIAPEREKKSIEAFITRKRKHSLSIELPKQQEHIFSPKRNQQQRQQQVS